MIDAIRADTCYFRSVKQQKMRCGSGCRATCRSTRTAKDRCNSGYWLFFGAHE